MLPVRSESGWTVVELVFTLSLIGLITSLVVPAVADVGERAEREMFLDFLAADLQLAQMEAVSRQEEVKVHLDSDAHRIRVLQGKKLLRQTKIPLCYMLETNFAGGIILFRKTGQVQGGEISLLKRGKEVGKIYVQVASGRPRVEMRW